jgi:hypothetical protein
MKAQSVRTKGASAAMRIPRAPLRHSTVHSQPEVSMRKLSLKVDDLQVDSFRTGNEGRKGTVAGFDTVETEWCTGFGHPGCDISHKPQCQTPNYTCYGTCGCSNGCDDTLHVNNCA